MTLNESNKINISQFKWENDNNSCFCPNSKIPKLQKDSNNVNQEDSQLTFNKNASGNS